MTSSPRHRRCTSATSPSSASSLALGISRNHASRRLTHHPSATNPSTTEEQIYELFNRCSRTSLGGGIKRIIMGLDRNSKTPCGFAFVEYYTHAEAVSCMRYINGTKLDERVIRCDLDPGYRDGRQYGRGKSGGQVRDEYREEYDAGRGGWGHNKLREEEERRRREQMIKAVYGDAGNEAIGDETRIIPAGAGADYDEAEGFERAGGRHAGQEASAAGNKRARDDEDEGREAAGDDEDDRRKVRDTAAPGYGG